MNYLLFCLINLLLPVLLARYALAADYGWRFARYTLGFAILLGALLMALDSHFPFTNEADDEGYYLYSFVDFARIEDWFNLRGFQATYEQSGYVLLLAWVNQFAGDSLYARKAMNLLIFFLVAIVWSLIGRRCGGDRVGLAFGFAILIGTPLWFYWAFILKDIMLVLLQSIFLLGAISIVQAAKAKRGYLLAIGATLATIPFRMPMVSLNVVMLVMLLAFIWLSRMSGTASKFFTWVALLLAIGGILVVGRNPQYLLVFGVTTEGRRIDYAMQREMIANLQEGQMLERQRDRSALMNAALYLVGETAGLKPEAWRLANPQSLRGLAMVPWIVFGIPLFLAGCWSIVLLRRESVPAKKTQHPPAILLRGNVGLILDRRALLLVALLAVVYWIVAILVSDTTRYRMPGFPAMLAIAAVGWLTYDTRQKQLLFLSWLSCLAFALALYWGVIERVQ